MQDRETPRLWERFPKEDSKERQKALFSTILTKMSKSVGPDLQGRGY